MIRTAGLVSVFLTAAFACSMVGYYYGVRRPDEVVEVRIRRLVVAVEEGEEEEAKKKAERAAGALREGKPFAEVAEEAGDRFAARTGGLTGYLRRGQLKRDLEEAAFSAPLLRVQGPIETDSGYVVFVVVEKRMRY